MINYIIQVLLFQTLFLVVYDLFLKNETFFQWNRFYLLTSSIIAYIIPFIKINSLDIYVEKSLTMPTVFINNNPTYIDSVFLEKQTTSLITLENIYLLGIVLMVSLFLFKVIGIIKRIKTGKIITKTDYKLVILNKEKNAFSFFNYIFLGETVYNKEHLNILNHELIHVKQKHSLDLLLFEIQKIVFWFNPFSYLYQNRISVLHEYIADAKTIASNNKKQFFENLLNQTFKVENLSFVNNYYKQSLLKKRIIMTTKNKSKQILKMKYLLVLPLVLTMLVYTSCSAQVVKKTAINEVIPPPPPPPSLNKIDSEVPPPPPSPKKVNGEIPPPPLPPPTKIFKNEETISFSIVDKAPVFPGCEEFTAKKNVQECFQQKLSSHVTKYFNMKLINSLGLKDGMKKVHAQFVINKNGEIEEDVMVVEYDYNKTTNKVKIKKTHPKIVKEVKRIIGLLPQMKSGLQQDGKPVKVRYSLPIAFNIGVKNGYIGTINGKSNKQVIKIEKLKSIIIGSAKNDVEEKVISFKIKVRNNPTYKIKGNKLDKHIIEKIKKDKKNNVIIIFDILNDKNKNASTISFQVTN